MEQNSTYFERVGLPETSITTTGIPAFCALSSAIILIVLDLCLGILLCK